jgi:hypothetical protein
VGTNPLHNPLNNPLYTSDTKRERKPIPQPAKRQYNKRNTTAARTVPANVEKLMNPHIEKKKKIDYALSTHLHPEQLPDLLKSTDPFVFTGTLNDMLLGSIDPSRNFRFDDTDNPLCIVHAIVKTIYRCYGIDIPNSHETCHDVNPRGAHETKEGRDEGVRNVWATTPLEGDVTYNKYAALLHRDDCTAPTDDQVILLCLTSIRNFSLIPSQARCLANHALLLITLTKLMLLPEGHSKNPQITIIATDTVQQLSEYYDVKGYRRYLDTIITPQASTPQVITARHGLACHRFIRDTIDGDYRWNVILEGGSGYHVYAVCDLIWNMYNVVTTPRQKRGLLLKAMDVLETLGRNDDNCAAFDDIPVTFIDVLIPLLFVPKDGPDGYHYENQTEAVFIGRITPYFVYDNKDSAVDWELRDAALGLLNRMSTKGPVKYRNRIAEKKDIVSTLLDIVSSKIGRSDVIELAGSILTNLCPLKDFTSLQAEFQENKSRMIGMCQKCQYCEGLFIGHLGGMLGLLK